MSRAALRQRLKRLTATIRPAHSLAARLDALTPLQRAIYDRWRTDICEWIKRYETRQGGAYAVLLDGVTMPKLAPNVAEPLFGTALTLPASATIEQAAEAYRRMLDR